MRSITCFLRFSPPPAPPTRLPAAEPQPAPPSNVDNQAAYDMDVSVLSRGDLVRLGFAPAEQVDAFRFGAGDARRRPHIRFEAHPTLGGQRVVSDPYTVHLGDTLTWVIPPQ